MDCFDMKPKNLFLMCGCPGSGKSTWVRKQIEKVPSQANVHVSRDVVRFAMVSESEEYFSRETEVFKEFIRQIQEAINSNWVDNIFVDATHLNEKSRNKVLDALKGLDEVNLMAVSFELPLEICLSQNRNRFGTRAFVPEDALTRMYSSFKAPSDKEKYKYNTIYHIGYVGGN